DVQSLEQAVQDNLNEDLEPLFLEITLSPMQMKIRVEKKLTITDKNFMKMYKIAINPYYICINFIDYELSDIQQQYLQQPIISQCYLSYDLMERYRIFMNRHGFKIASTQQFELLIPVCSDQQSKQSIIGYQKRLYAIAKQMTNHQFYDLIEKINAIRDEITIESGQKEEEEKEKKKKKK
ncbi:hypothetical protein RFI_25501, partial [Reticulomyxa filosa]